MQIIEKAANKLSALKLFCIFNASLILGAATLVSLHYTHDLYAPIPLDAFTIGPLAISWLVVAIAFVFEFLCLHQQNKIQNLNAAFALISIIEIGVLGYATERRLTTPFLNHKHVEYQNITNLIRNANTQHDLYREKDLSFVVMTMRSGALLISYNIEEGSSFYISDNVRAHFKEKSCGYFSNYSQYKTLETVVYNFLSKGKMVYSLIVSTKDCNTTEPKEQNTPASSPVTPASMPMPEPAHQETIQPAPVATKPLVMMPPVSPRLMASSPAPAIASKTYVATEHPVQQAQATLSPEMAVQMGKLEKSLIGIQQSLEVFTQRLQGLEAKTTLQPPPTSPAHQ